MVKSKLGPSRQKLRDGVGTAAATPGLQDHGAFSSGGFGCAPVAPAAASKSGGPQLSGTLATAPASRSATSLGGVAPPANFGAPSLTSEGNAPPADANVREVPVAPIVTRMDFGLGPSWEPENPRPAPTRPATAPPLAASSAPPTECNATSAAFSSPQNGDDELIMALDNLSLSPALLALREANTKLKHQLATLRRAIKAEGAATELERFAVDERDTDEWYRRALQKATSSWTNKARNPVCIVTLENNDPGKKIKKSHVIPNCLLSSSATGLNTATGERLNQGNLVYYSFSDVAETALSKHGETQLQTFFKKDPFNPTDDQYDAWAGDLMIRHGVFGMVWRWLAIGPYGVRQASHWSTASSPGSGAHVLCCWNR